MFALIASFVRHIGNYPVETGNSCLSQGPLVRSFYVGRFNVAYMTRKQSQRDGRSPFFVKKRSWKIVRVFKCRTKADQADSGK